MNPWEDVKYVCDRVGAFWLVDAIGSYQYKLRGPFRDFQLWVLTVENNMGVLELFEDSGKKPHITQVIKYTDFPEGRYKFYLCNGVLMLPNEY